MLRLIQRRDRKLHDQLERGVASISLNIAEGRGRDGGDKRHQWRIARGSAEEALAALYVADAFGYISPDDWSAAYDTMTRVHQTLWRMTH